MANEISPGTVASGEAGGALDDLSTGLSFTAIVVTQATTVATARNPASQSRRVPGAREESGDQPFSHGWSAEGRDLLSGMRCSFLQRRSTATHGRGGDDPGV
ncbi:hypothetical protein ACYF6T_07495 [Streptomyces sp. 7R007]